jgi:hypothetical protein
MVSSIFTAIEIANITEPSTGPICAKDYFAAMKKTYSSGLRPMTALPAHVIIRRKADEQMRRNGCPGSAKLLVLRILGVVNGSHAWAEAEGYGRQHGGQDHLNQPQILTAK